MPVSEAFYSSCVLSRDQKYIHDALVSNARSSVTGPDLVKVVADRLRDHPMHRGMEPTGVARIVQEELSRLVANSIILVRRGNVLRVDQSKLSR